MSAAIAIDSVEAAETFGMALAGELRVGDIVTLEGPLGAGKTTLARGVLRGLGHVGDVPSPTFAIVQDYAPPSVRLPLAHVDLYRLDSPEEAEALGLDEALYDGALLVEWPDRLPLRFLGSALHLSLAVREDGVRDLTAHVPAAWEARWPPQ